VAREREASLDQSTQPPPPLRKAWLAGRRRLVLADLRVGCSHEEERSREVLGELRAMRLRSRQDAIARLTEESLGICMECGTFWMITGLNTLNSRWSCAPAVVTVT
jgi:hypothetical protein